MNLISHRRLTNQLIDHHPFETIAEVVGWMGFIQAQDYLGALWAVGLRLPAAIEPDIEKALAGGEIIRTWPARGTLHFVAAEDIRWILDLLGPRMFARSAARHRQLGLGDNDFAHSRVLIHDALQGGKQHTRDEMYRILEAGGVSTTGQRGIHILGRLAQEGLICFGPRAGKQQTFVLLSEWAPQAIRVDHDRALADLTRRYFTSHGPATLQDFVWWSGLPTTDARIGIDLVKSQLSNETFDDQEYWCGETLSLSGALSSTHLLPAFDEYLVGYKDRRPVLDPAFVRGTNAGGGMLNPVVVIDGQVVGTWKRILKKDRVLITPAWFETPGREQIDALNQAAGDYGKFLELPVFIDPFE